MFRQMVMKLAAYALCGALTLTIATPSASAGGFYLSVEAPPTSTDLNLKEAVFLIRPYGCHNPSEAVISATAEGLVGGRRRSVPLGLTAVSSGLYAAKRQWPAEGVWVIVVSGKYLGATSSSLVELEPGGNVRRRPQGARKDLSSRAERREFTGEEVEAALQSLAGSAGKDSQALKARN